MGMDSGSSPHHHGDNGRTMWFLTDGVISEVVAFPASGAEPGCWWVPCVGLYAIEGSSIFPSYRLALAQRMQRDLAKLEDTLREQLRLYQRDLEVIIAEMSD